MCAEGTGCHRHSSVRARSYLCMRMPRADLGTLLPVPSGGGKLSALLSSASAHALGLRVDGGQTGRYVSLEGNALLPSPAVGEHQPPKKKKEQKQRGHSGLKSELQKSIGDGEDQSVAAQARKGPEDFRSSERKSAAAAAAEQLKTQVSASALNANKLHLR